MGGLLEEEPEGREVTLVYTLSVEFPYPEPVFFLRLYIMHVENKSGGRRSEPNFVHHVGVGVGKLKIGMDGQMHA